MLHGVLNMPPELWIGTPIDVMQRHSRYIQASEYIKELTEQRDRLAEERDELKKQLIDAKSSTAFWMGKYNNAMQLRGEDPLCDSFWKTLDKLSAERALADRLAEALRELWNNHTLHGAAYELIEKALAAVEGGSDE
jgi:hypothetical protein